MSSASTDYLKLVVFPDITGVYQREIRLALVAGSDSNMHKIDAGVKALADALDTLSKSLSAVAKSGSYTDLVDADNLPDAIPIATVTTAGKVKPDGDTILVDENGVIKAAVRVAIATTENAGIVKPDGDTILVDKDGVIKAAVRVAIATTESTGIVKPDGSTISIDKDGTIHGRDAYTKAEVDALLADMSDIFITDTDKSSLYTLTNTLLGVSYTYKELGADILTINSLAQTLIN